MLKALVHQKLPEIRFVEYFKDVKYSNVHMGSPLVTMTRGQFERIGLDFVQLHFKKFETIRMTQEEASPLFSTEADIKLLKKHVPLIIYRHHETGHLVIVPCKFRQYRFCFVNELDRDLFPRATLPIDCSNEEFVTAFNAVAAEAG